MSAQHTPGPWVIGAYGRVTTLDGETLRTCGVAIPGSDSDEYRANTRLIAAAPDLLAALRDCLAYMENDIGGPDCCGPERAQAHAAIAKAQGSAS